MFFINFRIFSGYDGAVYIGTPVVILKVAVNTFFHVFTFERNFKIYITSGHRFFISSFRNILTEAMRLWTW
jgi:hypothetical protein